MVFAGKIINNIPSSGPSCVCVCVSEPSKRYSALLFEYSIWNRENKPKKKQRRLARFRCGAHKLPPNTCRTRRYLAAVDSNRLWLLFFVSVQKNQSIELICEHNRNRHKHISNDFLFSLSPVHISFSLFSIRPLLLHWLLSSARQKCSFRCSRFGQRPTNNVQHISMRGTFIFIMCQYADIVIMRRNNFFSFRFDDVVWRLTRRHKEEMRTWTWDAGQISFNFLWLRQPKMWKNEKFVFTKRSRSMQMHRGRAAGPSHHQISHLLAHLSFDDLSVSFVSTSIEFLFVPNNRTSLFSLSLRLWLLVFGIAKGRQRQQPGTHILRCIGCSITSIYCYCLEIASVNIMRCSNGRNNKKK